MRVTPINEAEAILDPLWDPALSELDHWTVDPGSSHGLRVYQNWCWAAFEWARRPAGGPALRLSRVCGVDCSDYDRLLLSVMAPEGAVVRLLAETDCGSRRLAAPAADARKRELTLTLDGAARLESVAIEVDAGGDGIAGGWFNWLGLQHSGRLAHKLAAQTAWDARWPKHLMGESFEPTFTPAYGLVLGADEMAALRLRHAALTADGGPSPFRKAAEEATRVEPESLIHDYVNFWGDTRYNRERDHGRHILNHGLNAAVAGHLLRDRRLLRLAARYAMSIGMCKTWDDGFICRFPGGSFEHRCFVQSLCAYEVAGILDLAGECFTDSGREFLLRRLAEEAVGSIQFNTWKHEYIFGCNQLAWFTSGRMLALGVLQRHWPRVRAYLDIAYAELCESLERSVLPDGGYVEGPTYFRCVGRDAGLGVYYYSRASGQPMAAIVPEAMKRCGDFAEALMGTDDENDVIPICDGGNGRHEVISQAIMARLLPESTWVRMLQKTVSRSRGWPAIEWTQGLAVPAMTDAAIAWGLLDGVPAGGPEPRAFVHLSAMGPLASQRRLRAEWVKLFIQGNHAGAGHTHEDKGSFVLEFAGETFALDPGSCDYSHPLSGELGHCERHNMLVPCGAAQRPRPECPLSRDVKPFGEGDETAFRAQIDATPGWEEHFRRWHRAWDSPTPDVLTITDEYELLEAQGVEFHWQTRLPVEVTGGRAVITGQRGRVELDAPPGCPWRVDELPLLTGVQRRLTCRYPGRSGTRVVRVRLALRDE